MVAGQILLSRSTPSLNVAVLHHQLAVRRRTVLETEHETTHVGTSRNSHCKIQLSLMCAACRVRGGDCWTRGSLTDRGGGSIIHWGSESASHRCRVRRSGRMILVAMRADLDGVPLRSFHPPHLQRGTYRSCSV